MTPFVFVLIVITLVGMFKGSERILRVVERYLETRAAPADVPRLADVARLQEQVNQLHRDVERSRERQDFLERLLEARPARALPPDE
jgi:hypothetical protein